MQRELQSIAAPNLGTEHCESRIVQWLKDVLEYYSSGVYSAGKIVPTQNYVMQNHGHIEKTCPVAWLVTLVLKLESNLQRGRDGLTCARVHAKGCLRDARGYWKGLYVEARQNHAGSDGSVGNAEMHDLLVKGEMRIAESFKLSLMGKIDGVNAAGEEL